MRTGRQDRLAIGGLCVTFFALYTAVSVLRFSHLDASGYDLGIFTQAVKAYAQFKPPVAELKGEGYLLLGDHFHPILVLLAPLFRLFPSPITLLVQQAALFALAVYPITRAAVRQLGRWSGLAVGVAFGLSFGVQQAVLFDFHEIAFAVPLIAFSGAALLERRWLPAALWAVPLLLVKEDQFLIVGAIGAYIFWYGSKRIGAALSIGAGLAGLLTLFVVIPFFNTHGTYDYLTSVAPKDTGLIRLLTPAVKWELVFALLLITAFLALRSPLTLLIVLPVAARFWVTKSAYWRLEYQYNAVLMPILFVAFLDGLARLATDGWFRRLWDRLPADSWLRRDGRLQQCAAGAVLVVALLVNYHEQPIGQLVHAGSWRQHPDGPAIRSMLADVPSGSTVAADNHLAPYLVMRARVFLFPDAIVAGTRPAWVIVRDDPDGWPVSPIEYSLRVALLPTMGYVLQRRAAGLALYRQVPGVVTPAG